MEVYIRQFQGQFEDDWLYAAFYGANKLGMKIIFFEDIMEVPKDKFVITFVEPMITYLNRCNIKVPKPLNIPDSLNEYTERIFGKTNLNYFINNLNEFTFPIFIKPNEIMKGFPSGVLQSKKEIPFLFNDIKNLGQGVEFSTFIDMESEYRCFVYKNELVGVKNYQGSFELFPAIHIVKEMIDKFKDSPIAYTIDVAITPEGHTILVECQDMISIGNYGLNGATYVKMLRDRWFQIMKTKNN